MTYNWLFSAEQPAATVTTNRTITHVYPVKGVKAINVTAWNLVSEQVGILTATTQLLRVRLLHWLPFVLRVVHCLIEARSQQTCRESDRPSQPSMQPGNQPVGIRIRICLSGSEFLSLLASSPRTWDLRVEESLETPGARKISFTIIQIFATDSFVWSTGVVDTCPSLCRALTRACGCRTSCRDWMWSACRLSRPWGPSTSSSSLWLEVKLLTISRMREFGMDRDIS